MTHVFRTCKKATLVLALSLIVAIVGFAAFSKNVRADDSGAGWSLTSAGVLTVSDGQAFNNKEWENSSITITSIVLRASEVPANAFDVSTGKYDSVTSVSVVFMKMSFGAGCFKDFPNLTTVDFSSPCAEVPEETFSGCENLQSVTLSSDVKRICDNAFNGCTSLTTINLDNVTGIYDSAFEGCTSLATVNTGNLEKVSTSAFEGCSSLTSVDLSNVNVIGGSAFSGCSSLTSVTSLSNVTGLGEKAFKNCSSLTGDLVMTKMQDPIGQETFYNCSSLTSVDFGANNWDFSGVFGVRAFSGCTNLETVVGLFNSIDEEAFKDCVSLSNFDFSKVYCTIGTSAFENCDSLVNVDLSYGQLGKSCFANCDGLESITLSSSIKTIPESAFQKCTSLNNVDLRRVTKIEAYAFSGCTSLTNLTLGYNLNVFSSANFDSTTSFDFANITDFYFFGTKSLFELRHYENFFPNATLSCGGVYDVVFDYGDYTEEFEYEGGEYLTRPDDPDPDDPCYAGLIFTGWYLDKDSLVAYDFSQPVSEDLTLYAGWVRDWSESVFKGYTLSLGGQIGVNFYTVINGADPDTDYIQFTVEGIADPQIVYLKDARTVTNKGTTYLVFQCRVSAKNMTSVIMADLYVGGENVQKDSMSVRQYAQYILDNEDTFVDSIPLVTAMLNYGAYAQEYFGYETGNLANAGIDNSGYNLSNAVFTKPYDSSLTNLPEGLSFTSVSLVLKSDTVLKLIFTDNTDKDLRFFLVDGANEIELTREGKNSNCVIRITGIPADKLNNDFRIKIVVEGDDTEYGLTYSPMTYAYNAINRGVGGDRTQELIDLMKSFYLYYKEADLFRKKA